MLKRQKGSILLEGLVAVAIFAFGFLALLGLQAASIKQSIQAKYRNDAALLANQIIGQMMVDQGNLAAYAGSTSAKDTWQEQVAATLPNGAGTITIVDTTATPRTATVTVTWRAPDETTSHSYVTATRLMTPCYDPATSSTTC